MPKFKKDMRDKLWHELELEIQRRENKKDRSFKLCGKWKRFLRIQDGLKVYAVDGKWIRNNLSVIFGHGGHGYVHEFIPKNEIWVSTHHYHESSWSKCGCDVSKGGQKVSENYFDSTTIHEIAEFKAMRTGKSYWESHQIALQKEEEAGLLKNPYYDKLD